MMKPLDENLGFVILKGLEMLPSDRLRNEPSEITLITNYLDYINERCIS